jgi:GTP-binding protein
LFKEGCANVSLRVEEGISAEQFVVSGRGELQLSIVIETMRREGYAMEVGKPKVIEKTINGVVCEPYEHLVVDIPEDFIGVTREFLAMRKGILLNMSGFGTGMVRLEFQITSRGLIGIRSTFLTVTRGMGVMNSVFDGYKPKAGSIPARINGALVSSGSGQATSYAIEGLSQRGRLFIFPGTQVYAGMIVGEHARENDLDVNIVKQKKLTNMRSSTSDETIVLTPPLIHSLESAMEWIKDNEAIEITPKSIRLRRLYHPDTFTKNNYYWGCAISVILWFMSFP